jgi:predicted AlkP superfamily phosphohydrolase/phosphomutase
MQRVFMIGWDGATFDLMRPWIQAGKLPNIARLIERGVQGPLRSTLPPWTFPAWSSFMTGKNPGKHGIYDFFRPLPGKYDLDFVNGSHRKAKTFWQILSEAGRNVVSISVPTTFPPERVKGVMISGFDFPGASGGGGSFVDGRGIYPPDLYVELLRAVGPHPIDAGITKEIDEGKHDVALGRILETIGKKTATVKYLMKNKPWDCFMILYGESDSTSHQYWRYCDPKSPLFTDQPPGLQDSILKVYQELDRQVAELIALLPAETTVLMMSDHGFGGVSDWVIYPNCWLRELGLLHFHSQSKHWKSRVRDRMKLWAVTHFPAWLQRALMRFAGGMLGRFETGARYGIIDWSKTEAYFDENPYFPVLRINLKGRQPQGVVEPGRAYEDLRDRLIRELEAWRHPSTGAPIVEKAFRREEIYTGPCVNEAADIIPKWSYHQGYSYAYRNSSKSTKLSWIEQIDPKQLDNNRFYANKSGNHRDDGIFIAQGTPIRPGYSVEGAKIIDLAPTILHLLDVASPSDMDGRILEEIFTDSYLQAAPVKQTATPGFGPMSADEGVYSSADEEKIEERLKALGYVE